MGRADDVFGGLTPDQRAVREATADTAVFEPGLARAVRKAAVLAGLVPMAEMTDGEVAWVFAHLA